MRRGMSSFLITPSTASYSSRGPVMMSELVSRSATILISLEMAGAPPGAAEAPLSPPVVWPLFSPGRFMRTLTISSALACCR